MRMTIQVRVATGAAALSLALAVAGCGGGAPSGERASGHEAGHPETFDAAKALASERNLPLLVDFYSPT